MTVSDISVFSVRMLPIGAIVSIGGLKAEIVRSRAIQTILGNALNYTIRSIAVESLEMDILAKDVKTVIWASSPVTAEMYAIGTKVVYRGKNAEILASRAIGHEMGISYFYDIAFIGDRGEVLDILPVKNVSGEMLIPGNWGETDNHEICVHNVSIHALCGQCVTVLDMYDKACETGDWREWDIYTQLTRNTLDRN